MFDLDSDDTNKIKPTAFDKQRLMSMDIGQKIMGEYGNWQVIKYKNSYNLFLLNHSKAAQFGEFFTLGELIKFLENN